MRDFDYCKVMLEAYRDILHQILNGLTIEEMNVYVLKEINDYQIWKDSSECENEGEVIE